MAITQPSAWVRTDLTTTFTLHADTEYLVWMGGDVDSEANGTVAVSLTDGTNTLALTHVAPSPYEVLCSNTSYVFALSGRVADATPSPLGSGGSTITVTVTPTGYTSAAVFGGVWQFDLNGATGDPLANYGVIAVPTLSDPWPACEFTSVDSSYIVGLFFVTASSGAVAPPTYSAGTLTELAEVGVAGGTAIALQGFVTTGAAESIVYNPLSTKQGNGLFLVLNEPAAVPVIDVTALSSLVQGSTATVAVVDAGVTQGTLTLDGAVQSITSWVDNGNIEFTVDRSMSRYGPVTIAVIRNDATSSDTVTGNLSPPSGWSYVDLSAPLTVSGDRITAVADLEGGDQLTWGNVEGGGAVTIGDNGVIIFSDGSFICDTWVSAFDVTPYDTEWGVTGTQTFGGLVATGAGTVRSIVSTVVRTIVNRVD